MTRNTTRETIQAVERRPEQLLERHDMAENSTRHVNLETACEAFAQPRDTLLPIDDDADCNFHISLSKYCRATGLTCFAMIGLGLLTGGL